MSRKAIKTSGFVSMIGWALVLFGIFCRTSHYVSDRSFWVDEASVAMEVRRYSIKELFQIGGFEVHKVRPGAYGFLLVEKLAYLLLKDKEYVWRLFPFVCGLVSLFVFKKIANLFPGTYAGIVSLGLFAISPSLIYYSAEAKPYSCEVLFTLVLYYLFVKFRKSSLGIGNLIITAIAGGICLWSSFAAFFVLSAGSMLIVSENIYKRQRRRLYKFLLIGCFWLVNFALYYHLSLRYFTHDQSLLIFWQEGLLPDFQSWGQILKWGWFRIYKFFMFPADIAVPVIGMVFFIVGCRSLFRARKFYLLLLLVPLMLTFTAACLRTYPFEGRTVLFLTPAVYLLIAQGWEVFFLHEKKHGWPLAAGVFLCLLLAPPLWLSTAAIFNPPGRQEIKSVIKYIKGRFQEGDIIYIAGSARPIFCYYDNMIGKSRYIKGVFAEDGLRNVIDELERVKKYERVWLIFSDFNDDERFISHYLEGIGTKADVFEEAGCGCFLYEIKKGGSPP